MFRRVDLTKGKVLDAAGAFNGLTVLRGLHCCRITRSLRYGCPVVRRFKALEVPEPLIAFPDGSWRPCFRKIADGTDETLNSSG
jgi:hypothetical protein